MLARHPELSSRIDEPMVDGAFGATPLLAAVHRGNRKMVELLIAAGADVNARSHWWAGSFGVLDHDGDLVAYLIERGAVVDVHAAARLGMLDRLDELLGADPALVRARGGDGQMPLHFASSVEVAAYLLERGADIDARDVDHESTPAQWMVRDRQEVARYLVGRGCRTDIVMAAALGDVELVRRHLDADPGCVRTTVSERWFPKEDQRSGGTIYTYVLGANQTPHAVARALGHITAFELLVERSPAELRLALACERGDEAVVADLLESHPGLAQMLGEDDRRRLVDAAQKNDAAAVRLLLAAGWPPDARGQHAGTALHWAAFHGNVSMVREILRHNPPLAARDADYDQSPVGWARYGADHSWHRASGDYEATLSALLEGGVSL